MFPNFTNNFKIHIYVKKEEGIYLTFQTSLEIPLC